MCIVSRQLVSYSYWISPLTFSDFDKPVKGMHYLASRNAADSHTGYTLLSPPCCCDSGRDRVYYRRRPIATRSPPAAMPPRQRHVSLARKRKSAMNVRRVGVSLWFTDIMFIIPDYVLFTLNNPTIILNCIVK